MVETVLNQGVSILAKAGVDVKRIRPYFNRNRRYESGGMIDLIKKFFAAPDDEESQSRAPASAHDVRIATCALFLEMAGIDGEFTGEEQETVISVLKTRYGLEDEHVDALMESAAGELADSLDLWRFANLINENYSDEEKQQILELAWRIVYVDGKLDKHEDYLMRKFSRLLRIPHRQFIDAKLKAKRESST